MRFGDLPESLSQLCKFHLSFLPIFLSLLCGLICLLECLEDFTQLREDAGLKRCWAMKFLLREISS